MESWFCLSDDLLRLFTLARVAIPIIGLSLFPKRCSTKPLFFNIESKKQITIKSK